MNTQETLYHWRQQHDRHGKPQYHIKPFPKISDHHQMMILPIHLHSGMTVHFHCVIIECLFTTLFDPGYFNGIASRYSVKILATA